MYCNALLSCLECVAAVAPIMAAMVSSANHEPPWAPQEETFKKGSRPTQFCGKLLSFYRIKTQDPMELRSASPALLLPCYDFSLPFPHLPHPGTPFPSHTRIHLFPTRSLGVLPISLPPVLAQCRFQH